jgi:hypothetical protein
MNIDVLAQAVRDDAVFSISERGGAAVLAEATQWQKPLHMALAAIGLKRRTDKLTFLSAVFGRTLTSSNELLWPEAQSLVASINSELGKDWSQWVFLTTENSTPSLVATKASPETAVCPIF